MPLECSFDHFDVLCHIFCKAFQLNCYFKMVLGTVTHPNEQMIMLLMLLWSKIALICVCFDMYVF